MRFDVVFVGGGLQGCLGALAILSRHPRAAVAIVERNEALCGNHTWSFHAGDLPAALESAITPAVVARWSSWDVKFPGFARRIERTYSTIGSESLATVTREAIARSDRGRLFPGGTATGVSAHQVHVEGKGVLEAAVVVDARGPEPMRPGEAGFQKFLGLELEVDEALLLDAPIVMDADVPQDDGLRFVYALPYSPTRLLVEDTYYSDSPALDEDLLRGRVLAYAASLGARSPRVVREERGVLPLPFAFEASAPRPDAPLAGGYRGGFFHPTTGYSLPCAARFAELLAASFPHRPSDDALRRHFAAHASQARFMTALNRMLFRSLPPGERWRALARFHALPEDTVERFYALQTTAADRARILIGRPPRGIHVGRALRAFAGLRASKESTPR